MNTRPYHSLQQVKNLARRQRRMRRQRREGVVLLVVLTLLSLFIVVGTTFLLLAATYKRGADVGGRAEQLGDPPNKLLDMALYEVLRGTRDPNSVVRGHDLLGDFYGTDGFVGFTVDADFAGGDFAGGGNNTTQNQLLDVQIDPNNIFDIYGRQSSLRGTVNYYSGCVFTFVTGPARGYSTRVVFYSPATANANAVVRIVTPQNDHNQFLLPLPGDRLVVNGRPFNGTGFAYDANAQISPNSPSPRLATTALLPNWAGFSETNFLYYIFGTDVNGQPFANGGPDESYDAPDYQNMALAALIPADNNLNMLGLILPSFHRPELLQYQQGANAPVNRAVMRPMSRPLQGRFITTNINTATTDFPDVNELTGPWDVDNDADGVPDSIWVDLQFPIKTAPNGRQYKPLFAFLIVDKDSCFNLNYHGSRSQAYLPTAQPIDFAPVAVTMARNQSSTALPKGNGWGPADVNLISLFDDSSILSPLDRDVARKAAYTWLLQGIGSAPGRYAYNANPGTSGLELMTQVKFFHHPFNYFNFANFLTHFFTAPDLRAELAYGLDARGAPLYEVPGTLNDILTNNPYELSCNALRGQQPMPLDPNDQLFSLDEMERILRFYDIDAEQLPPRLLRLLDRTNQTVSVDTDNDGVPDTNVTFNVNTFTTAPNAPANRRAFTTESWDVPSPGGVASEDTLRNFLPAGAPLPQNIADIFTRRIIAQNGWMPPLTAAQQTTLNNQLAFLLSPDLFAGLRMDINRPIGNGVDNNGNGVVDELEESDPSSPLYNGPETIWTNYFFDHDNDGVVGNDPDAFLARQHLARHLYCLAMMLKDSNADIDVDRSLAIEPNETAYAIAQWAINAVDFRDADSVMTAFEFDVNPYDGWNVDGFIGSADDNLPDRGLVWGCERPELLMTETIAIHDRRTEDLQNPNNKTTDTPPDTNFDQRLQPQGAFFVELYNPWAGLVDRVPNELYANSGGVRLNQMSADGSNTPVWRLVVVQGNSHAQDLDPDAPPIYANQFNVADIERRVYFTPRTTLPATLLNEGGVHAIGNTPQLQNIAPVLPGRYAVVGTGRYQSGAAIPNMPAGNKYITPVGRRVNAVDGALEMDGTRQFALSPNPNPNLNQVRVLNNEQQDIPATPPTVTPAPVPPVPTAFPSEPSFADRQAAVAVVIDSPPLTVSEPIGGYQPPTNILTADNEGAYNPPLDVPLDRDRQNDTPFINRTGTSENFRTVLLQRLANPLRGYDVNTNPYLTVDRLPVNLTAFNGMIANRHDEDLSTDPPVLVDDNIPFRTQERGEDGLPVDDDVDGRILWPAEAQTFNDLQLTPRELPLVAHNFDQYLAQTLGYLNFSYWNVLNLTAPGPNVSYFDATNAPAATYIGAPQSALAGQGSPFPWLTWNNRPYVNQMELLQVPYTSSSQLLRSYSTRTVVDPYDHPSDAPNTFGHLLRFLASGSVPGAEAATHFYRLLEFTEAPSQFLDTDMYFNPAQFQVNDPNYPPNDPRGGTYALHPPFNWISRYRVPGKININTVYDYRIWENALRQIPLPGSAQQGDIEGPSFVQLIESRRGYPLLAPLSVYDADPTIPTRFANPFRAPGTGTFVPPLMSGTLVREDVETTLERSDAIDVATSPSNNPLMAIGAPTTTHNDARRNPYFHYQALEHMGNLVTTRSNVYAVWITVGYFEVNVEPITGQLALGRELGSDSGDVRRHRAFYVIDRTQPVAYEPGENHNVDRAILLRRVIE